MERMRLFHVWLILLISFVFSTVQAQNSNRWQVNTKDGNQYIGEIINETNDTLTLKTQNLGILKIATADIQFKDQLEPTKDGDDEKANWPRNHHSTRYFFGPNAFTLKKGEGYYQNTWVFFNHASYGITNRLTIGAGLIPIFLLGADVTPVWITPKVRLTNDNSKVNISLGAWVGGVIGDTDLNVFGLPYAVTTVGGKNKNLSVGVGYGMANGEFSDSPAFTISGMLRITKKTYLLTENYIFSGEGLGIVSLGARTAWTGVALDYGLLVPTGDDDGFEFALPWLGISIPFR